MNSAPEIFEPGPLTFVDRHALESAESLESTQIYTRVING